LWVYGYYKCPCYNFKWSIVYQGFKCIALFWISMFHYATCHSCQIYFSRQHTMSTLHVSHVIFSFHALCQSCQLLRSWPHLHSCKIWLFSLYAPYQSSYDSLPCSITHSIWSCFLYFSQSPSFHQLFFWDHTRDPKLTYRWLHFLFDSIVKLPHSVLSYFI
jgi:hypothetical protein